MSGCERHFESSTYIISLKTLHQRLESVRRAEPTTDSFKDFALASAFKTPSALNGDLPDYLPSYLRPADSDKDSLLPDDSVSMAHVHARRGGTDQDGKASQAASVRQRSPSVHPRSPLPRSESRHAKRNSHDITVMSPSPFFDMVPSAPASVWEGLDYANDL